MDIPKPLRVVLPLAVVAGGVAILVMLVKTKPEPAVQARVNPGTLVEVMEVDSRPEKVRVDARGTVVPRRRVTLSPEVTGRINWLADQMVPGGRFQQGELIARLDARDYRLAVEQQYANLDKAQTELKLEQSRKKVAEREWQLFGSDRQPSGSDAGSTGAGGGDTDVPEGPGDEVVALREPQMRSARTAVKAAKSGLDRAQLAVSKTTIRAPFNSMVQDKSVEIGQLVSPGAPVATLVGTDAFWVQVTMPADYLTWMKVPGLAGVEPGQGASATITQELGGEMVTRPGRVVRLLGDVDPTGRMARILVEIDDPLGLEVRPEGAAEPPLPLLLGSYVRVEIEGEEVQEVIAVPRQALREGARVYVRKDDDTLEIREVTVLWRREDEVLVSKGLKPGDQVIVSPISTPVPGLKLQVAGDGAAGSSRGEDEARTGKAEPAAPEASEHSGAGRDAKKVAKP